MFSSQRDAADRQRLSLAFDVAWRSIEKEARDESRAEARNAVGKAIMDLASLGNRNPTHLANYGAYQGRFFIDMRG